MTAWQWWSIAAAALAITSFVFSIQVHANRRRYQAAAEAAERARRSAWDLFVTERGHRMYACRTTLNTAIAAQASVVGYDPDLADQWQGIIDGVLEQVVELERQNIDAGIVITEPDEAS